MAYLRIRRKPLVEIPQDCIADIMPSILAFIYLEPPMNDCIKEIEIFNKTQLLLLLV